MLRIFAGMVILLALTPVLGASSKAVSKPAGNADLKAAPKAPPSNKLDTALVHKTYIDGDFDHAIEMLEDALNFGGPFTHDDSVFMFKHLGVMYAAKYETREKGKHFMLQLLSVEPTAKIMDMYASDMIYMIFKNIQDEFASSRPTNGRPDQGDPPHPDDEKPKKAKSYAWVGWTAGAAAAAGGIALTVHLLNEDEPVTKEHRVNVQ